MKKNNKLPKVEIVAELRPDDIESNVLYLTPEKKAAFYEEIFLLYMENLKEKNPDRWCAIQDMVDLLSHDKRYGMVLYMFKRVAPTFCDTKPITFLKEAIFTSQSFLKQFDMLCVFMQIAAFRWALIEKSIKQSAKARNARKEHVQQIFKQDAPFVDVFKKIYDENGSFIDHYKNSIINILVENPKILKKTLIEIRSNHKSKSKADCVLKSLIDSILNEDDADISGKISDIEKIKPLEKRFRDKYRRFCEHYKEQEIICFSSIDKRFLLSEIREIWWQQLPPWPIKECSEEFPPSLLLCTEMVMEESVYLAKQ